jgi:hypothetical protein
MSAAVCESPKCMMRTGSIRRLTVESARKNLSSPAGFSIPRILFRVILGAGVGVGVDCGVPSCCCCCALMESAVRTAAQIKRPSEIVINFLFTLPIILTRTTSCQPFTAHVPGARPGCDNQLVPGG